MIINLKYSDIRGESKDIHVCCVVTNLLIGANATEEVKKIMPK
jgi:hypothetical protein